MEARNQEGALFGFERTAEVVKEACAEDLSAEETLDRVLEEVGAFRNGQDQADDMTCVVVKVL